MTEAEIRAALDGLDKGLAAKGVNRNVARLSFEDNAAPMLVLEGEGLGNYDLKAFRQGDTASELIDSARAFIAALPSPDEMHRSVFLKKIADAIDFGEKHDVASDLVMPVQATFKALSENILTDQRAAQ